MSSTLKQHSTTLGEFVCVLWHSAASQELYCLIVPLISSHLVKIREKITENAHKNKMPHGTHGIFLVLSAPSHNRCVQKAWPSRLAFVTQGNHFQGCPFVTSSLVVGTVLYS